MTPEMLTGETRPRALTTGEIVGPAARVWAYTGTFRNDETALAGVADLLREVLADGNDTRLAGVLDELAGAIRWHAEKWEESLIAE